MPVFSFLTKENITPLIIATIVLAITGYITMKYISLTSEIKRQSIEIEKKTKTIADLEMDKMGLKFERDNFEATIDTVNAKIELLATNEAKAIKDLEEWKSKPAEIKYETIYKTIPKEVIKYKEGNCEDGLELNRAIAEMKYEDL